MPPVIPGPHADVLPALDFDFAEWGTNLGVFTLANPTFVILPTPAAVAASALAFDVALNIAITPGTRTTPTIAAKDAQRNVSSLIYRDVVRQLVAQFRAGIRTALALNAAGVRVPDLVPTPIAIPVTFPMVAVQSASPGQQILRASDSATPDKRAKPYGVIGLQLVRGTGPSVPVDGTGLPFVGLFTRQPMVVSSPPALIGVAVHYVGRWVTMTGKTGPWSSVVSFVGT